MINDVIKDVQHRMDSALQALHRDFKTLRTGRANAAMLDGIYTADPHKDPNAKRIAHTTYQRVLADRLQVMDAAAIDLARGSSIPIYIFSLREKGNIRRALLGEDIGSMVSDDAA